MKKYDTIFLDRDGTLNPDPGYINSLEQFSFFPFTMDALKLMKSIGNNFCIITNQSGIARGIIEPEELDKIHRYVKEAFIKHDLPLLDIFVCTDHPDQATDRRKPGTEMFLEAAEKYTMQLDKCIMIGDSFGDMEAGRRLGMDTLLVLTGKGRHLSKEFSPTFTAENLLTGAKILAGTV